MMQSLSDFKSGAYSEVTEIFEMLLQDGLMPRAWSDCLRG